MTGNRVIIVCGGTGGHIYPGLAVASAIRERDRESEIVFIGTKRRMESRVIPESGYEFQAISVEGIQRRFDLTGIAKNMKSLFLICTGVPLWQSLGILRKFEPGVIFGTGGYFSGPVILAGYLLGVPSVSMEPNMVPGMANRLAMRFVEHMVITHEGSREYFSDPGKCVRLGTPVRPEVFGGTREEAFHEFGLDPDRLTVLVMGGSLGSRNINEAVTGMVKMIGERDNGMVSGLQIIHSVGTRFYREEMVRDNQLRKLYYPVAYLDRVDRLFPAVDLFIGRVGASTAGETTALGIPMILVPWGGVHQGANAEAYARAGAAVVIHDDELTPEVLYGHVKELYNNPGKRKRMAEQSKEIGNPRAAQEIAELLATLSAGHGERKGGAGK